MLFQPQYRPRDLGQVNVMVLAPEGSKSISVLTVDDQIAFRRVAREVVEATAGFHSAAEEAPRRTASSRGQPQRQ